jgi:glycosyltransferase involved in cell wall biosynthesis/tetratricopeptide (TPR) repeat protein
LSANKVAACIITGDAYEEEEVKKLLKSLEPHVQGIFVNYNGKKAKLNWQKWTSTPIVYKKFKWEDDFGLARNQSFSLVPKDEYDWYLWIDTDDILVGEPGAVDKLVDSLDDYTLGVFLKYEYAVDPETDTVVVEQWRERLLSTKMDWNWVYPIHEVCRSVGNIQYAKRSELHIRHLRQSGETRGARDRNKKIIMRAAKESPSEPRYQFYLAGETLAEADAEQDPRRKAMLMDAAIVAYETYRGMVHDLTDDVYLATARMADLYRMKGDHAAALEADLECIAIYPEWPDGYVGAAKSCMELGDWPRMKAFASMGVKCPKPDTAASIEPQLSGFTPMLLRAMANDELGDMENALKDYKAAAEIWMPSGESGEHLREKIRTLEKFELEKDVSPAWTTRKKLRGTKKNKSIAFYTQPIPEVWNPETFKEGGHGGAETCIIKLSPMFAADGWRVVVFGTPGDYRGVHDGVEWWTSDEYLPGEEFHTFVSSRSIIPFDGTPLAKVKFLWMHDVNLGPGAEDGVLLRPDKVLGLTNWHADHLMNLYDIPEYKMAVMPNGIDPTRFNKDDWDKTDKNNFIYSSSPDRGLDTLLGLWPIIKQTFPEAKLHLFYGWEMINKIINMERQRGRYAWLEEFRNKCINQIYALGGEEGGIIEHGRVDQITLAKEMAKCNMWLYPTDFMETFCITALEMQMSGVIPVTSNLAALRETVNPDVPKIEGWPKNTDYQKRFLKLMASMTVQEEWQEYIREENREFAAQFTWENVYSKWNDLIKEVETGEVAQQLVPA